MSLLTWIAIAALVVSVSLPFLGQRAMRKYREQAEAAAEAAERLVESYDQLYRQLNLARPAAPHPIVKLSSPSITKWLWQFSDVEFPRAAQKRPERRWYAFVEGDEDSGVENWPSLATAMRPKTKLEVN